VVIVRRQAAKLSPAKPSSIIAHVEGSGIDEGIVAVSPFEVIVAISPVESLS